MPTVSESLQCWKEGAEIRISICVGSDGSDRLADLFYHDLYFQKATNSACRGVSHILIDEWRNAHERHGWAIGRYVIMPDRVHFFVQPS